MVRNFGPLADLDVDEYADDANIPAGSSRVLLQYAGTERVLGLPDREFLIAQSPRCTAARANVEAHIAANAPVYFMPNDIAEAVVKRDQTMQIFGVLRDGSKAHVILTNIPVFFEVGVPATSARSPDEWRLMFEDRFATADCCCERSEIIMGKPLRGYVEAQVPFIRFHFQTVKTRKTAIEFTVEQFPEIPTFYDDRSSHYRRVAREAQLTLTDWLVISNYEHGIGAAHPESEGPGRGAAMRLSPLCRHVFTLALSDGRPLINPMGDEAEQARIDRDIVRPDTQLNDDPLLIMTWDIETYSGSGTGDVPSPDVPGDKLFMICGSFHWKGDQEPLYRFCLIDKPCEPDYRWDTIVCGNEELIVKAFARIIGSFAPDIITGFNDGWYDWPFVIGICKNRYPGLLADLGQHASASPNRMWQTKTDESMSYNVQAGRDGRGVQIKVGADTYAYVSFVKLPGYVPLDMRPAYQKIYPKAEVAKGSSLNFYLKLNGITSKADVTPVEMWKAWERGDVRVLRRVARYCVIDALRCQQLQVKRSVIGDRREIATLSFTSLYDAIFYADGMKIRNMAFAYAEGRGLHCSNIGQPPTDAGKYPGAWVFPPKKGLYRDRPVTGLDFSSLYPSLIMAYNLSPDRMVTDEAQACRLEAAGASLWKVEFPLEGKIIRGWAVRHGGDWEEYGLFARILIRLFRTRKLMKKQMEPHQHAMERLAKDIADARASAVGDDSMCENSEGEDSADAADAVNAADAAEIATRIARLESEYTAEEYLFGRYDLKQRALKVYMNTFYGETGNQISPVFMLQVAGGITTAGRYNIKMVDAFVQTRGFATVYGDTDSLYLVAPPHQFVDADAKYGQQIEDIDTIENVDGKTIVAKQMSPDRIAARLVYWTEMVEITMRVLAVLCGEVNAHLALDNGTPHLVMAYEEVLFPVGLLGKKKYFGIAHEGIPNFFPRKPFLRGIDIVKQGQSNMAKKIGMRIIWRCLAVDELRTIGAVIEDELRLAITDNDQWSFDDFILTAAWKPAKKNISVQAFIARMQVRADEETALIGAAVAAGESPPVRRYLMPEPGERFQYVLVKQSSLFHMDGKVQNYKCYDLMEFASVVRTATGGGLAGESFEIDVAEYLNRYIVGLCARFINFESRFAPPDHRLPTMDYQKIDTFSQNRAARVLTAYVKSFLDGGVPRGRRALLYKRAFKTASVTASAAAGPAASVLSGRYIDHEILAGRDAVTRIVESASRAAAEVAAVVGVDRWGRVRLALAKFTNIRDDTSKKVICKLYDLYQPVMSRSRNTGIVMSMYMHIRKVEQAAIRALEVHVREAQSVVRRYADFLHGAVAEARDDEIRRTLAASENPEELGLAPGAPRLVLTDDERTRSAAIQDCWHTLVAAELTRLEMRSFSAIVVGERGKIGGAAAEFSDRDAARIAAEM